MITIRGITCSPDELRRTQEANEFASDNEWIHFPFFYLHIPTPQKSIFRFSSSTLALLADLLCACEKSMTSLVYHFANKFIFLIAPLYKRKFICENRKYWKNTLHRDDVGQSIPFMIPCNDSTITSFMRNFSLIMRQLYWAMTTTTSSMSTTKTVWRYFCAAFMNSILYIGRARPAKHTYTSIQRKWESKLMDNLRRNHEIFSSIHIYSLSWSNKMYIIP